MLASLGELRRMTPPEQVNWAFRTLTRLQGKLSADPDESLVCGFISSRHGEGRSTWVNLLVSAASQRGLRVLTVATRPCTAESDDPPATGGNDLLPAGPATTLNSKVLASPAQVTEQFSDPQAQPIVHIPLPGWVWNLERRRQWREALDQWRQIDNLVLLVELPPASQPESILLAESLPQVIWLVGAGMPDAEETQQQLETLRHARCNLVGAVLNRERPSIWRHRLGGWMYRFSGFAAAIFCTTALAQDPAPDPQPDDTEPSPPLVFSALSSTNREPWQQRFTLGPGDVVDITLYGMPEFKRTGVMIGPDGTLSYLELAEFPAAGLTVDELRQKLDEALARYYQTPRAIVVPVEYASKRYYVLGRVVSEGAYVLDRPLTLVEAIARANGLETRLGRRGARNLADLSRSFLVRNGERVPVDFEKLFLEGDLTQNIQVAPGDYLFFAPEDLQMIYLLGKGVSPGFIVPEGRTTLAMALTERRGFLDKAYRSRVLVVRGSLDRPETFVVDAGAILAGREPDFVLAPGDIIYVTKRPWYRAEELLDEAAQAFILAAWTTWVGTRIDPIITEPIIK